MKKILFSFLFLIGTMIVPTSMFSQVDSAGVSVDTTIGISKASVQTETGTIKKRVALNFTPDFAKKFGLLNIFISKDITLSLRENIKQSHKVYSHEDSVAIETTVLPANIFISKNDPVRFLHIDLGQIETFRRITAEFMMGQVPLDLEFRWSKKIGAYYLFTKRIKVGARTFDVINSGKDGGIALKCYHMTRTKTDVSRRI